MSKSPLYAVLHSPNHPLGFYSNQPPYGGDLDSLLGFYQDEFLTAIERNGCIVESWYCELEPYLNEVEIKAVIKLRTKEYNKLFRQFERLLTRLFKGSKVDKYELDQLTTELIGEHYTLTIFNSLDEFKTALKAEYEQAALDFKYQIEGIFARGGA